MSSQNEASSPASSNRSLASGQNVAIPSLDIVSYAFGQLGEYDLDKPIFIDGNDDSSFVSARQSRQIVRQLVAGLKAQGLKQGACICLHTYNNIFFPLLWLGAIGAGGCVSGSNPAYTVPELAHHLTITKAQIIIAEIECIPNIAEAARKCQIPESRVFVLHSRDQSLPLGYQSWEHLLQRGETDWRTFHAGLEDEESHTIAVLGSTSGTTGLPKAAAISHRYLVAQAVMIQEQLRTSTPSSQIVCLPVFHAFASQLSLVLPLRSGKSTYFIPRFKLPDFVKIVERFAITETAVVPPIISAFLNSEIPLSQSLRSLRYILCAGASIDAEVQQKLYRYLSPLAVIAQVWGTTETGWATISRANGSKAFDSAERDDSGSVGRPLSNVEVKIVDENGIVGEGEYGEACIRTPSMFQGYVGLDESSEIDSSGWFRSGDRACLKDGQVFINGRMKEVMKVNGWQVSPAELEGILLQNVNILDAAVVGINLRDEHGFQITLPRAYVVRSQRSEGKNIPNSSYDTPPESPSHNGLANREVRLISEEEVKAYIASKVVSYKKLTGGVVFVSSIPRTNTGKILRRLLGDDNV